jgi:hypothetical protein
MTIGATKNDRKGEILVRNKKVFYFDHNVHQNMDVGIGMYDKTNDLDRLHSSDKLHFDTHLI